MTDAWRHLTDAAIRYNKRLCNKEAVIDAYARGEKTIGNLRLINNKNKYAESKEQGLITDPEFLQIKQKLIEKM